MCEHLNAGMIKVQKKDIIHNTQSRDIWYKGWDSGRFSIGKTNGRDLRSFEFAQRHRLTVAKLYIAIRCIETQPGINPMGMCTTTRLT